MEPLYLPDLEERTLARFDELARKEKIFYEKAASELITVNGFDVSRFPKLPTSMTLMRVSIKKQSIYAILKPLRKTGKLAESNDEQQTNR